MGSQDGSPRQGRLCRGDGTRPFSQDTSPELYRSSGTRPGDGKPSPSVPGPGAGLAVPGTTDRGQRRAGAARRGGAGARAARGRARGRAGKVARR